MAFLISGMIHLTSEFLINPVASSGTISFFVINSLGIMVEDFVQYLFPQKLGKSWRKIIGYIWVTLFFTWITPVWSFPQMRANSTFPLPFRIIKS
jgi:hypothetical protein